MATETTRENMQSKKKDAKSLPLWARGTLTPRCPLCGNYLMPCTQTANGIHPNT